MGKGRVRQFLDSFGGMLRISTSDRRGSYGRIINRLRGNVRRGYYIYIYLNVTVHAKPYVSREHFFEIEAYFFLIAYI